MQHWGAVSVFEYSGDDATSPNTELLSKLRHRYWGICIFFKMISLFSEVIPVKNETFLPVQTTQVCLLSTKQKVKILFSLRKNSANSKPLENLISIIAPTFPLKRFNTIIARICPRFLVSCCKRKIILSTELIKLVLINYSRVKQKMVSSF